MAKHLRNLLVTICDSLTGIWKYSAMLRKLKSELRGSEKLPCQINDMFRKPLCFQWKNMRKIKNPNLQ